MMKKVLAGVAALVCIVALAGCNGGASAGSKDAGSSDGASKSSGEPLVIGVDDTYPPMEFVGDDSKSQGFDIDVANEIGKILGREVKFESTQWSAIFSALDSKKFDAIISSVSITEERQGNYSMSKPYVSNNLVMVTKPDSGITKPEELKDKIVAVQTGTTADDAVQAWVADDSLVLKDFSKYETVTQCFDDLKLERVDAVVVDVVVAMYYIKADADKYKVVWESDAAEPIGVCMRKDDTELTKQVNDAIDELGKNGKLKEISQKWFNADLVSAAK